MNANWKKICLTPNDSLKKAMQVLSDFGDRIALVVDKNMCLCGTVTDGDIRRGLLNGFNLDDLISQIMNKNPITVTPSMTSQEIQHILCEKNIFAVPIVDDCKNILGLEFISGLNKIKDSYVPVLIMAGGFGKRLGSLTQDMPKPMLTIGRKPILEHIIDNFTQQGLKKFFISTHYKSDTIKNYFNDGKEKGIEIEYLEEDIPLGTAGGLFFLKKKVENTFIVINGDLLVGFNFNHLIEFHENHHALVTMCVRQSDYEVPYGVVQMEKMEVKKIIEKPRYVQHVNAGIYCFSHKVLEYVKDKEPLDMPDLLHKIIQDRQKVLAFPLHEHWIDIGSLKSLNQAQEEHA